MLLNLMMDKKKAKADPRVGRAAAWLCGIMPEPGAPDFLGWNLASTALFWFDGPEGPLWKRWNEPMKQAILPPQRVGDCPDGSWNPEGNATELQGGRVLATALNVVTMEVFYRYANVFGGR